MMKNEYGQVIGFTVENWHGARVPSRTPMEGTYVSIACVKSMQACQSLYAAYVADTDGTNWTYLPYGPFAKFDDFSQWFESTCFADDPLFHVVYDKATGTSYDDSNGQSASGNAVGLASLLRIDANAGAVEVGHIHFSPTLQRTRMSTETMYLMMKRVFDDLGYRRYEWKCDALNEPSKKAALRLGFTYEGTFRQALVYKNRNRDTAWFSVTDKEWPAIKAGFEAWLQADNFSHDGIQIKSLSACRHNEI